MKLRSSNKARIPPDPQPRPLEAALADDAQPLSIAAINALRHHRSNAFPHSTASATSPNALTHQIGAIVGHLLAVQSQDDDAMMLSIWTRLPRPRPTRRVLLDTLVASDGREGPIRFWGNRGTLQLATASCRAALCAACTRGVRRRRLASMRKCPAALASLAAVERETRRRLRVEGAVLSSDELTQLITQRVHKRSERERDSLDPVRMLYYSMCVILTADMMARRRLTADRSLALVAEPRPRAPPQGEGEGEMGMDEETAVMECAKCFFNAYGPATVSDLRYWLGVVPAAQCHSAVHRLLAAGSLTQIATDLGPMLVSSPLAATAPEREEEVVVVVRGRFDPVLLAHSDKTWVVAERSRTLVWTGNANVRAVVLARGLVIGVWSKHTSNLFVELFDQPDENDMASVRRSFDELARDFYADPKMHVNIMVHDARGSSVDYESDEMEATAETSRPCKRRKK